MKLCVVLKGKDFISSRLEHCVQGKEKSDLDQQSVFFDWYEDTGNVSPEFPVLDVFVDDFYLYPSKVITLQYS